MPSFQILTMYVYPGIIFIIMLGMGLALKPIDFQLLILHPKVILLGLIGQMVLLPLAAILLILVIGIPSEIAVGLLLLAASPGGVTSNAIALAAKADIALSVSLTAISSVLVAFTLPLWAGFAMSNFMSEDSNFVLPIGKTIIQLALLTILPLVIGMLIRYVIKNYTEIVNALFRKLSIALIFFLALSSAYYNLSAFSNVDVMLTLIFYCCLLMIVAMLIAYIIGKIFQLPKRQGVTIIIEVGVQNVAITLLASMSFLQNPEIARLPVIYGLLMICVPWFFIYYVNKK